MSEIKTIAIAGNPNCGKTTIFNALTGGKQRIGNWPGVTVEKKSGTCRIGDSDYEVVDLPGIYSLTSSSLDEEIARDYLINEKPDMVINIVDASNIERNLYLSVQLAEMKVPMVLVFNMVDIVKENKIKIKYAEIAKAFGCGFVQTVAHRKSGVSDLLDLIKAQIDSGKSADTGVYYPEEIEAAVSTIKDRLSDRLYASNYDKRWLALKMLEDDISIEAAKDDAEIKTVVKKAQENIGSIYGDDADVLVAENRYGFINALCKKSVNKANILRRTVSDAIDKVALNRFLGIPVFLVAMYFTFWITINFGAVFIDFFDIFAGTIFVDGLGNLMASIGLPDFLIAFIADGLGGAIQTVATFIPPIFFMFLCLSVLEDSGYMARAAFVMDRFMRAIGLPGKAFVPMLVGFGCTVPAIMATRTLENDNDRKLTIMMNPFMSCGARMPVYALFAAAFFPQSGGTVVFAIYMLGILLALFTALIFKRTLFPGSASSFIMELPPYHIPTFKGVFIHTWGRLKSFILRAGKAIMIVVVLLSFLNSWGTDGSFGNSDTEQSVLSSIGKSIVPIFEPMGMREENWPAAVGIFTGIFAKEAVVGTLDALYHNIGYSEEAAEEEGAEEGFDFWGGIQESFAVIPENLSGLEMPLSIGGFLGADVDGAIEELETDEHSHNELRKRFDGKVGAFAYLIMILLYMPCVAAIAAVYRELNFKWMAFSCVYLSGLAWVCSTLFYQLARFSVHPASSFGWIAFCAALALAFLGFLKFFGRKVLDLE